MIIDLFGFVGRLLWLVIKGTLKLLELAVLALLGGTVLLADWLFDGLALEERLQSASPQAHREVDRAHREARLAMNDAAGQPWRSLVD